MTYAAKVVLQLPVTSHPDEGLDEVARFATDWMTDSPGEVQLVRL